MEHQAARQHRLLRRVPQRLRPPRLVLLQLRPRQLVRPRHQLPQQVRQRRARRQPVPQTTSTATTSTATTSTATTGVGLTGGADGGTTGEPPDPYLISHSDELGYGRILSWTGEDLKFTISLSDNNRVHINSISTVEFKVEKIDPGQSATTVCDWTAWEPYASPDSPQHIIRHLRLDSTNFLHGSQLGFTTRVKINMTKEGGSPQDFYVVSEPASAYVKNGVSEHVTTQSFNPIYTTGMDYSNAAQSAGPAAKARIETGNSFRVVPQRSQSVPLVFTGPELIENLGMQDVTAVVAFTHGASDGFWHSGVPGSIDPDQPYLSQGYVRPNYDSFISAKTGATDPGLKMSPATGSRNTLDPINCMILYACETLKLGDALLQQGPYHTAGTAPPTRNKAVMGFEEILNMYVLKQGNDMDQGAYTTPDQFKEHSNILMNELILNKNNLQDSLRTATNAYSPLALDFGSTASHVATDGKTYYWAPLTGMHTKDFKIVGDKKTRWRGLYVADLSPTGTDRIQNTAPDDWLYIFKGRE